MTTTTQDAETTTQTTATETTKPARQSRASRSAQANGKSTKATAPKPAAKKTTAKKTPAKPAAPKPASTTELKQAVASAIIAAVAEHLSKTTIPGVHKSEAMLWAGQWLSYMPGARAGKLTWDRRLGPVSQAGAAKKSE